MSATWGYDDARRAACVAAFGDWHSADLWKHNDDLRRYDQIIRDTRPDVIIETGTNTGASASWMAAHTMVHPKVITIDVQPHRFNRANDYGILRLAGDSAHPELGARVRVLLNGHAEIAGRSPRVMVSLDSDHSAAHVRREIELYAPLVTPGCYLVVEDGILAWLRDDQLKAHGCAYDGTPLDAIADSANLLITPEGLGFERDEQIEFAYPVTMSPAGWWRRDG